MKKISLICKIFGIIVLVALFCAGCEKVIPTMPTAISTKTPIPTFTPELTITPTKPPPSTEWQLSPDGHIYYKESELYGGMFTINKEHPEWVEKYWEDTIRGLWNLNNVGENTKFINQFPTDDALVQYLKDGDGHVNNLWIPEIYPSASRIFIKSAILTPVNSQVDLSQIAIAIYKPTTEEIYKYSPSYATGTKYVSYFGGKGEALTEVAEINSQNILKITLRRDLLIDAMQPLLISDQDLSSSKQFSILAITEDSSAEENLLAATQLVQSWPLHMQIKDAPYATAYMTNYDPALLNFNSIWPLYGDYTKITTLDWTPLSIR